MLTGTSTRTGRAALAGLIVAVSMTTIDQTIVALCGPTIETDLGISHSSLQWAVNVYLIATAAFFLLGGRLADVFGHRRTVLIGIASFGATSLLCSLAPSGAGGAAWLITARALQGVAGALMFPAAIGLSVGLHAGSPVVDAFYAAPRDVPSTPGQLIRAESFTRDVPQNAVAWRILYTTTRGDGTPAVASGLVVVPKTGPGNWPVIDWDHGTTGFAQSCAPSLLAEPFASEAMYVLPEIIDKGWAFVATDYIGLGTRGPHPYLIGKDSAHASLDAVRAAQQLDGARLGKDTVIWGHSQGGGAALWSGALAPQYAPELKIHGVAALAPAANLPGLVRSLGDIAGGSVFASYVVAAYTETYPDVTWREYIRPGAEPIVRAMSQRCLSEPGMLVSVLDVLALSKDPDILARDPTTGPLGVRLEENVPPATIAVPVLMAQGAADTLVIPAAQQEYVDKVRAEGERVDYRTYPGRDHVPLVEPDSPLIPELFAWTHDRFREG